MIKNKKCKEKNVTVKMSLIVVQHLKKEYKNTTPLVDVNAEIQKGDVISVIGPHGSGKSTLLRCMNRLEMPTAGKIWIDGTNIMRKDVYMPVIRRKIGMMSGSFCLFSHLTILENLICAPVELLKISKEDASERGLRILQKTGLLKQADAYPNELSKGQRHRAMIARTLAMEPEIVLFDDPDQGLDSITSGEVIAVLKRLASDGLTMLIATHNMRLAAEISKQIFYMDLGIIYEQGTPEQILKHPLRDRTRNFVLRHKMLHVEVDCKTFDFPVFVTQLEEFGRKWKISQKQIFLMQYLSFEIFVKRLPAAGFAEGKLDVEYTGDGVMQMYFFYSGREFKPFREEERAADTETGKLLKRVEYGFLDGVNLLICKI